MGGVAWGSKRRVVPRTARDEALPAPGYRSLTTRMVVADVAGATAFLRAVFGATGDLHAGPRGNGKS